MQQAERVQALQTSYIREILAAANAPGVISLAGGLPPEHLFPLELMTEALQSLPQRPELFQYGNSDGYQPLLELLAVRYQQHRDHRSLVCNGSQQALDLIARCWINPGDEVVVETPSYLGALQVFDLAQATIRGVAQDDQGPDLMQLEAHFATGKIKLFYAVPDFHNPTGLCWSAATRQAVAQLCRRFGVILVEDAPYRELRFSGVDLPMVSTDCAELAFTLRSFSKVATPGIRLGTVTGPHQWIDTLARVKQAADLHTAIPMQEVTRQLLSHEQYPQHLATLRTDYRRRYTVLAAALTDELGHSCQFAAVAGGMFVWLQLPPVDAMALAQAALKAGLAVVPGEVFYPRGVAAAPALRLNFTHASEPKLRAAVQILGSLLQ